ncbi:helix-turn-helix domain-containing protein [Pelagicoccus mobilis]|uniref:Helix-turn-helix domain-containing protein n=1 Tax=Pelagicoccus mobilis TaxID=415221 RepID=A0A934RU57_9BACT|nr:AraC family transcriptional regulator [Pelagicoccus mobilis]MBK1877660.1 helix-turn-helix domain-containing protein [Pelagicoccus mobilis]
MRGFREYVDLDVGRSFSIELSEVSQVDYGLHHHPQWEFTAFRGANGIRGVGDSVEEFRDGDMALVPANVPHFWNIPLQPKPAEKVGLNIIKFSPEPWRATLELPEMRPVANFLAKCTGGYRFTPHDPSYVFTQLERMRTANSAEAIGLLWALFGYLAQDGEPLPLSNTISGSVELGNERLKRVLDHLNSNFQKPISLESVARVANLSPIAFSRYFSQTMGRPLSRYLNELRLSWACNQLLDTDHTVLSISLEAGYTSLTNFNRRFREIKEMTPREYRKRFR